MTTDELIVHNIIIMQMKSPTVYHWTYFKFSTSHFECMLTVIYGERLRLSEDQMKIFVKKKSSQRVPGRRTV